MRNNLVDVDAHRFKNHIVHRHGNNVIDRLFDLDVKHGDEWPDQRLDMCVLLRRQQQPSPLQGGWTWCWSSWWRAKLSRWQPTIHLSAKSQDDSPWCSQSTCVDTACKMRANVEVDPTVGLLWAFHVHADDEDVLHAQIDWERVGELDPTVVVDALGRSLDDNVNLMWRTPDPQNLVFGTCDNAGHDTGMPAYHGVFVVGWHADQLHAPLAI